MNEKFINYPVQSLSDGTPEWRFHPSLLSLLRAKLVFLFINILLMSNNFSLSRVAAAAAVVHVFALYPPVSAIRSARRSWVFPTMSYAWSKNENRPRGPFVRIEYDFPADRSNSPYVLIVSPFKVPFSRDRLITDLRELDDPKTARRTRAGSKPLIDFYYR